MNALRLGFSKGIIYAKAHKVIACIVIVSLVGGTVLVYKKINGTSVETRYVLAAVERGTLITSVSGTGQVSTSNQVDIKPKVSGDITDVPAKVGHVVKKGDILVRLNARDALKTLRDAQANLTSAQISYQKAAMQSKNSVTNSTQSGI